MAYLFPGRRLTLPIDRMGRLVNSLLLLLLARTCLEAALLELLALGLGGDVALQVAAGVGGRVLHDRVAVALLDHQVHLEMAPM